MTQLMVVLMSLVQIGLAYDGPQISQPELPDINHEVRIYSITVRVGKPVVASFHSTRGCHLLGRDMSSAPLEDVSVRAEGLDLKWSLYQYPKRWRHHTQRWAVHVALVSTGASFGPEYSLAIKRRSGIPFALVDLVSRLCRVSHVVDPMALASIGDLPRKPRMWLVDLITMASILRLEDWQRRAGAVPYDFSKLEQPLYSLADRCGRRGRKCHSWARLVFVISFAHAP
jgi:hypothetical protein